SRPPRSSGGSARTSARCGRSRSRPRGFAWARRCRSSGASSAVTPTTSGRTPGAGRRARVVDDTETPPVVLVHCGWPADRELIGRLLATIGAECLAPGPTTDLGRLVTEDRLDLVLADSSGGHGPLGDLLAVLDARPEARDLPLILLADATDVSLLADLTARRY